MEQVVENVAKLVEAGSEGQAILGSESSIIAPPTATSAVLAFQAQVISDEPSKETSEEQHDAIAVPEIPTSSQAPTTVVNPTTAPEPEPEPAAHQHEQSYLPEPEPHQDTVMESDHEQSFVSAPENQTQTQMQTQHQVHVLPDEPDIVPDSDNSSNSGFSETDVSSITTSLRSSIFQRIEQHGHGYHTGGKSILPIDESEQDRLDLQHYIWSLILDGALHVTPLPADIPQRVIDVGTGTGIWAIDMGDRYPLYKITGVDQAYLQPAWVPPNVNFEIDNVTSPWLDKDNSVDFIHVRSMAGSIRGPAEWATFLSEAYRILKPGGRIEISDFTTRFQCDDGTFSPNSSSKLWEVTLHEIAGSMGVEFEVHLYLNNWLRDAGFANVNQITHKVPVGAWPKDKKLKQIGRYHQCHMLDAGFENYSIFIFTKGGWAIESVQILLAKLKSEIRDPKIHSYTYAVFFMAEKPMTGHGNPFADDPDFT